MYWGGRTDKAYRDDRLVRAKSKIDQLIDRLKLTISDVNRNPVMSETHKRKVKNHLTKRINELL